MSTNHCSWLNNNNPPIIIHLETPKRGGVGVSMWGPKNNICEKYIINVV
jgi:hypothetical protein